MPRLPFLFARRLGPLGMALTAWDIWRRLPPRQRKRILQAVKDHGPRLGSRLADRRKR